MIISTYKSGGGSCKGAKRIYAYSSDLTLKWVCPECKGEVTETFEQVPLISYGDYCHWYYCDECGLEDSESMYTLNSIDTNDVNITLNTKYDLKGFRVEPKLVEIGEEYTK